VTALVSIGHQQQLTELLNKPSDSTSHLTQPVVQ